MSSAGNTCREDQAGKDTQPPRPGLGIWHINALSSASRWFGGSDWWFSWGWFPTYRNQEGLPIPNPNHQLELLSVTSSQKPVNGTKSSRKKFRELPWNPLTPGKGRDLVLVWAPGASMNTSAPLGPPAQRRKGPQAQGPQSHGPQQRLHGALVQAQGVQRLRFLARQQDARREARRGGKAPVRFLGLA